MIDRYGPDALSLHERPQTPSVPAVVGDVVEEVQTGFVGEIMRVEKSGGIHVVVLEGREGVRRTFPLGPGFWIDGQPVILTAPVQTVKSRGPRSAGGRALTASGSFAVADAPARVARASRIWVEGRHDAELVERIWGDDLWIEGVVVELLDGIDHLVRVLREFKPGPGRRAGVLVDHLVPRSKESRIAADAMRLPNASGNVLILGHPYVDVWQAVKPARVGLTAWPDIPRDVDIKVGTLAALGWPHADQGDVARGWKRILGTVRTYADLEPALLGRMEELIDFVTAP